MSKVEREIIIIKENHGEVLLMGDFYIKLIEGNSRDTGILEIIIEHNSLIVLNRTEKCKGLWTRINTKRKEERSVIDYMISTQELYNEITDMTVDEEECYKLTGKTPSDHNTIILNTSVIPVHKMKENRKVKWRITSETDWKKYRGEATNGLG